MDSRVCVCEHKQTYTHPTLLQINENSTYYKKYLPNNNLTTLSMPR